MTNKTISNIKTTFNSTEFSEATFRAGVQGAKVSAPVLIVSELVIEAKNNLTDLKNIQRIVEDKIKSASPALYSYGQQTYTAAARMGSEMKSEFTAVASFFSKVAQSNSANSSFGQKVYGFFDMVYQQTPNGYHLLVQKVIEPSMPIIVRVAQASEYGAIASGGLLVAAIVSAASHDASEQKALIAQYQKMGKVTV